MEWSEGEKGRDVPRTHGPSGNVFHLGAGDDRCAGVERLVEEPVEVGEGVERLVKEGYRHGWLVVGERDVGAGASTYISPRSQSLRLARERFENMGDSSRWVVARKMGIRWV